MLKFVRLTESLPLSAVDGTQPRLKFLTKLVKPGLYTIQSFQLIIPILGSVNLSDYLGNIFQDICLNSLFKLEFDPLSVEYFWKAFLQRFLCFLILFFHHFDLFYPVLGILSP